MYYNSVALFSVFVFVYNYSLMMILTLLHDYALNSLIINALLTGFNIIIVRIQNFHCHYTVRSVQLNLPPGIFLTSTSSSTEIQLLVGELKNTW